MIARAAALGLTEPPPTEALKLARVEGWIHLPHKDCLALAIAAGESRRAERIERLLAGEQGGSGSPMNSRSQAVTLSDEEAKRYVEGAGEFLAAVEEMLRCYAKLASANLC